MSRAAQRTGVLDDTGNASRGSPPHTTTIPLPRLRAALAGAHAALPAPGLRGDASLPLSLYVHLPWCLRKCPYCDFNSHERELTKGDEDAYVAALTTELDSLLNRVWGRNVQSVFIGGGTPSLFSPESIDRILAMVRARLRIVPGAEVTMEANPGTFERERFAAFRAAGVNRLSLGVQSFDDARLKAIGRVHDGAQARAAAETAIELFESCNLDLMYALPGQSLDSLRADVDTAVRLGPAHLSMYHLTLEPNTRFERQPPSNLPDEDTAAAMQDEVDDRLATSGFEHYEVSAHAKPGHRCAHNLNYWQFGDYLGIGAGAHSKLSSHEGILRRVAVRHPRQYLRAAADGDATAEETRVLVRDLPFEFMMNVLRLTDGVAAETFETRTGLDRALLAGPVRLAVTRGLLDADPTRFVATPLGARFLNDLLQCFLPQDGNRSRALAEPTAIG